MDIRTEAFSLAFALGLAVDGAHAVADVVVPLFQHDNASISGFSVAMDHDPGQYGDIRAGDILMAPVSYELVNVAASGGNSATSGVDVAITATVNAGQRLLVGGAARLTGSEIVLAPGEAVADAYQFYSLQFEVREPLDSTIFLHISHLDWLTEGHVRLRTAGSLIWERDLHGSAPGIHTGAGVLFPDVYSLEVESSISGHAWLQGETEIQLTAFDFGLEVGPVPAPDAATALGLAGLLTKRIDADECGRRAACPLCATPSLIRTLQAMR